MTTKYNPGRASEALHQLRNDGYKVFVSHRRPIKNSDTLFTRTEMIDMGLTLNENWDTHGGYTIVSIEKDGNTLGAGLARCSTNEVFSKKRGLTIALGRALVNARL